MLRHMPKKPLARRSPSPRGTERRVSLFRNGRNQAVRIPRDLELEGDEALIRKEGDSLVIEPVRDDRLLKLLQSWGPIDDEFPDVDSGLEPLGDVTL
jgi:antitoxin VapB